MPSAPLPEDETERLRALRTTGLLENNADPLLEAIVREAAALFGVPIAAITLLGETRQSFIASVGLGVPSTRRDMAFCGYVILASDPLVVLDARRDERFADNALVTGAPGIRFYAGAPVYSVGRQALGALCVIDTDVRAAVAPELSDALRALAEKVSNQFAQPLIRGGTKS